jgi:hypothetical protein
MPPLHLRKVGPALEKLEIWSRMEVTFLAEGFWDEEGVR